MAEAAVVVVEEVVSEIVAEAIAQAVEDAASAAVEEAVEQVIEESVEQATEQVIENGVESTVESMIEDSAKLSDAFSEEEVNPAEAMDDAGDEFNDEMKAMETEAADEINENGDGEMCDIFCCIFTYCFVMITICCGLLGFVIYCAVEDPFNMNKKTSTNGQPDNDDASDSNSGGGSAGDNEDGNIHFTYENKNYCTTKEGIEAAHKIALDAAKHVSKQNFPDMAQKYQDGKSKAVKDAGSDTKKWTKDRGNHIKKIALIPIYGAVKAGMMLSTYKKDALNHFKSKKRGNFKAFYEGWYPPSLAQLEDAAKAYVATTEFQKIQDNWEKKYLTIE